jgi:hypothetical protein
MELLKTVMAKIVGGACALAVIVGGISWWRMDGETRSMILGGAGRITGWLAIVMLFPFAAFFIIARVARIESNFAAGLLVLVITALEVVLLAWLFNWNIRGAPAWTFLVAAALLAGVYNLLACDWIAEKLE